MSFSLQSTFNPTWLYIKEHNVTGLKYFGKTTRDPLKYKGSGTHWTRHISKHGNDTTTIWCQLFTDREELTQYAVEFSIKNNIVESAEWANLIVEDGLGGGGVVGRVVSDETRKKQMGRGSSEKTRALISLANTGKKHSEETLSKMRGRVWSDLAKNTKSQTQTSLMQTLTEEQRKKYGANLKGKPWPEARRAAYIAKQLNNNTSKEVK